MIPKRLIQTAKSEALPPEFETYRRSWTVCNPDLEVAFFDDATCRQLFAEAFPDLLGDYDNLPFPVMKADVFRYAALFWLGGIYADVDMECLQTLPEWIFDRTQVLSVEAFLTHTRQEELRYPYPMQIANCIMASEPRHPFFELLVRRSIEAFRDTPGITKDVIEDVTGPKMMTRELFAHTHGQVELLHPAYLMPPLYFPTVSPIGHNMLARHHTYGSWKDRQRHTPLRRRLIERNKVITPWPKSRFLVPADVFPGVALT